MTGPYLKEVYDFRTDICHEEICKKKRTSYDACTPKWFFFCCCCCSLYIFYLFPCQLPECLQNAGLNVYQNKVVLHSWNFDKRHGELPLVLRQSWQCMNATARSWQQQSIFVKRLCKFFPTEVNERVGCPGLRISSLKPSGDRLLWTALLWPKSSNGE